MGRMNPAKSVTLTADAENQHVLQTSIDAKGINVIVDTVGGVLGSGTLTLGLRAADSSSDFEYFTLALGDADNYYCGGGMQVVLNLSGSTAPDVDITISEIRG